MPRSWRYSMTELPGTLQRSCREAQQTFLSALDDAVRIHGAGDQAHRIAYMALKQKFEKRGDHWIAKDNPADWGGAGKLVSLLPAGRAAASRSSAIFGLVKAAVDRGAAEGTREATGVWPGTRASRRQGQPGPQPRRSRPGRAIGFEHGPRPALLNPQPGASPRRGRSPQPAGSLR